MTELPTKNNKLKVVRTFEKLFIEFQQIIYKLHLMKNKRNKQLDNKV